MNKLTLSYLLFFIITFSPLSSSSGGAGKGESDLIVINNVKVWNHPTKAIFNKYQIELVKVELSRGKTYPTFFVKMPYDPLSSQNDSYYNKVLLEILKANGWWDYSLNDSQDGVIISIKWDKRQKTMQKDFISIRSE
jgi:hypothetical protein